ncbi:MAG: hypothetical protein QF752_12875 [Planctomycetota bacterium]|nr:hypothetical protein [Planctomycetota bacterium]
MSDLKVALKRAEQERRRKNVEISRLDTRRQRQVERLKEARRNKNELEVDFLWGNLKATRSETVNLSREAKILNMETIALRRYVQAMERMRNHSQRPKLQDLLGKIRTSGLEEKIAALEIKESDLFRELEVMFDGFNDGDDLGDKEDDPEKEAFLSELDHMIETEASTERSLSFSGDPEFHQDEFHNLSDWDSTNRTDPS